MKEIGEKLKNARESIGVSIEEASEDLKISPSQITDIENGNVESFQDVFNLKYFIRDYAKYLGLDKEEIAQVIEVLGAVSKVITDITSTDFNLKDMTSGEAANDLGKLLNTLQDNANKNGVFEQTYDAFIEYIKADEQIGSQVTEIIAQYPQDKIDWVDLISKLPKDEG